MSAKVRTTRFRGCVGNGGGAKNPASRPSAEGYLYEWYDEMSDSDVMKVMHNRATEMQRAGEESSSYYIRVTRLDEKEGVRYFTVEDTALNEGNRSYTVFEKDGDVYMRDSAEFYQLLQDVRDGIKEPKSLTESYCTGEPLDRIPSTNNRDCAFMAQTIVQSLTGITENCRIRRPGLKVNGDYVKNSKYYDEIENGEKDVKDFEEKVDKECTKHGIDNPLIAVPSEENASYRRILPNAHNVLSEGRVMGDVEIIFENGDRVLYKDAPAIVLSVSDDTNTARIQTADGKRDVSVYDLEPDPKYMGSVSIEEPEDDLNDPEEVDMSDMNDLSSKTVDCNIIVDGYKVNMYECKASLSDIMKSRKSIRVVFENDDVQEFDQRDIQFIERPYAVVVDSQGKPVRTIQIDPTSYINADESAMVDCLVAGKETRFPKSVIKILS